MPDPPTATAGRAGLQPRVVTASIVTIVVAILPGFLPGALAVQLSSALGIAETGVGLVVGAFFGMSALVSPQLGRLVERLNWTTAMRLSALGAGVVLGLTPLVSRSVLTLGLVTVAGGAALALAHPAVNLALARCTEPGRQGLAYGFKHSAIPAATALAGLGLPLIAIPFGWEWVYWIGAAVAVCALLLIPASPHSREIAAVTALGGAVSQPHSPKWMLVAMAVGAGLGIFAMDALATFLVPYAVDSGLEEGWAGVLLAAGSGLGIAMRLVAGWLVDRRASGGLITVAAFLALGAVGTAILLTGARPAIILGSLLAFLFGWGWSGVFTFAVVHRNQGAPAASTGVTMTGVYVGAAAGPALFGVVAETSYTTAWAIMAVSLAVGALLMSLVIASERP